MTTTVNSSPDGAGSVSQAKVKSAILRSKKLFADSIDITALINYIEIFTSISSPFLTVNINISDTMAIESLITMRGYDETITLDIRDINNTTGFINKTVSIYAVSDKIVTANAATVLTIKCISYSARMDMSSKPFKTFSGYPHDIFKTLSSYIDPKNTVLHLKDTGEYVTYDPLVVNVEETKNKITFCSNMWTASKCMKYLCEKSLSKRYDTSSYVFFERKDSLVFESLTSLKSKPATNDFLYIINSHDIENRTDLNKQLPIIYNLYIDNSFNAIDRFMLGSDSVSTVVFDHISKKYISDTYFGASDVKLNKVAYRNTVPQVGHIISINDSSYTFNNTEPVDFSIYSKRQRDISSLTNSTIEFEAAGRFFIDSGDVINVAIPQKRSTSMNAEEELSNILDTTLSGRYLVTSLRHLINRERHTIHVQASKDSFFKDSGFVS